MSTLSRNPTASDLDSWFLSAIRKMPVSNGLAILIGCTKSFRKDQPTLLHGVLKDLNSLEETFQRLMFTTLRLEDPNSEQIKRVLKHVSRFDKEGLVLPESWKRIVVTFSGHGGYYEQRYCLCAKDNLIDVREDIVDPLLPQNAEHVALLPKLFFIDACRGDRVDEGVEIVWPRRLQARGSSRVSSRGNYLLACSTLEGYQSLEYSEFGGIWMQMLCHILVNVDDTILNVLTLTNNKMEEWCRKNSKSIQQPMLESTINDEIRLLQEAQELRKQQQQQQQQQQQLPIHQPQLQPLQQQQQALPVHQPQLQQQQQAFPIHQPQLQQQQQAFSVHQPQLQQQQQAFPIHQPQFQPLQQQEVWQQQQSVQQMQLQQTVPLQAVPQPGSHGAVPNLLMPSQEVPAQSLYLNELDCDPVRMLDQYFEKGEISQPAFEELLADSLHQVTTGLLGGCSIRGRGSSKETAAKDAVVQIQTALSARTSKARGCDPQKKKKISWTEKLENYFKDQGVDDVKKVIKYETKLNSEGYKSTVFCPQLGYVMGEACPTEKKAEQDAAKKALKKLTT